MTLKEYLEARLIDRLATDIEKDRRFLSVPDVKDYYDGERRISLGVIASLDALSGDSERVLGAERH